MTKEAEDQIASRVNTIADRYSGSLKRSKGENDARAADREKIETMGYDPKAFQHAVGVARSMSKSEADHYLHSLTYFVGALMGRQMELFPEDANRIVKRAEKKAAKAAGAPRTQAELDANTDTSERSAPDAGGAKPQVPVDNPPNEQADGEQALNAGLPKTRKSQSQQAAEKLEAAKLAGATVN